VTLQDSVQAWLPKARDLSVADVLRLCSGTATATTDWSEIAPALAEQAVTELLAARAREGERLADMLLDRIKQLRALAKTAAPLVPQLVEQQRQKFLERWKEAMALGEGSVAPRPPRTAPWPKPRPLPSASTWPKKSRVWALTSTKSSACSKRAATSASAWTS
jgi:hypothetical protein